MTEIYTNREKYWIIRSAINACFDTRESLGDISDRYVVLDGLDDLYGRLMSAEEEISKYHQFIEELKETIDKYEYKELCSATYKILPIDKQLNFMEE